MLKTLQFLRRKSAWRLPLVLTAIAAAGVTLYRAADDFFSRGRRVYEVTKDWQSEVRHLVDSGGTVGAISASDAFAGEYLDAIFGSNPSLLNQLKTIIARGLAEDPTLNLGEVAAMIVTYRQGANNEAEQVVATVVGGFPLNRRKPAMSHDGYMSQHAENGVLETGNSILSLFGRDMVHFADSANEQAHKEMMESVMQGDIIPITKTLDRPYQFTAVFPDPKRLLPPQLRSHVQALVLSGYLSKRDGAHNSILLCNSDQSSAYAESLLRDMQTATVLMFKDKFGGTRKRTAWGHQEGDWWASECAKTLESAKIEREKNVVRMNTSFGRVMVNAELKSLERLGHDMHQIRGTFEERMDPGVAVAAEPAKRWTAEHKAGPDWPIPP